MQPLEFRLQMSCYFIDAALVCDWYAGYCKRALKNINSAKGSIDINIFKGREKKNLVRGALRWCLLIPFHPTGALEKVDSWNDKALKKKSERAHLNDLDYRSPQPCLWFWKEEADTANSVCGLTQSQVDRQVIGVQSKQTVKGREREREGDRHGAIMKKNANGGEGSQGRSVGKGSKMMSSRATEDQTGKS